MTDLTLQEREYLTVRELAELLRIKERKVYDLAASGNVPCSRATGKLLFPADEIRHWIESAKSGGNGDAMTRRLVVLGSHDPLLDWAIRESQCGLATYFDGSLDGVERFSRGEGIIAGLHVYDEKTSTWNINAVHDMAGNQNAVLVHFARRKRGLVLNPDGPKPKNLSELAGLRFTPRQKGSGTVGLFSALAAQSGLDPATLEMGDVARTEDDAVLSVRRGDADVTFGLEAIARTFGLEFVPLIEEDFSILVDRKAWFEPPFQTLLTFCQSDKFRQRAESHGGYDVSELGKVAWNG